MGSGGERSLYGRIRKIWVLPGFQPQNVQLIANRYTGYFTLATKYPVLEQKLQYLDFVPFERIKVTIQINIK
jgi:hypothetical protein